ncbi:cyclic nucleotide binding regulatory protein [Pedobacter sp. BAL39]|uniref:Crp/Fnr family transcriptional regulator n=1 Tax=Pedobacter sp. BAL39 TaxID=391596 RepID=UPI000155988E|nr:Crp/Fnr family transcriptional regulator [Pedobacter sp. BAL39]EDM38606.1 cyclic nucleotide binding regulatory protein [Pedobacter sp. BAL39]
MRDETAIISYVNKFVKLSPPEAEALLSAFQKVVVKKRQSIIQPDFPAPYRYYVLEGAMRAYVAAENGQEHTISFAIEDWWITDYNSYLYQQPATMFVTALEDTIALRLSHVKEQELKAQNPKFETFFRIIAERGLAYQQRRIIINLTKTAEARYGDFLDKYPLLAQRVPQYTLASFLGMTTEYLSKLRKRMGSKKT